MKNITLSAEEDLIENARNLARRHDTTLNQMFRDWLGELAARQDRGRQAHVDALFNRMLGQVNAGRKFTREELNECEGFPRHRRVGVRLRSLGTRQAGAGPAACP